MNKIHKFAGVAILSGVLLTGLSYSFVNTDKIVYATSELSPDYQSGPYILNNTGIDISNQVLNKIQGDNQSIILNFNSVSPNSLQAIFGISNSNSGYRNNYFDIFMRNSGEIGVEIRDAQKGVNYLFARPASLWGIHKGNAVENTVVFTANATEKTYSMYVDGKCIFSKKVDVFIPIKGITGQNNAMIGAVNREGSQAFTMNGKVNQFQIFNRVLSSSEISEHFSRENKKLIFQSGDTTNANYFRIPTLYTLNNGRVLSSIDARYGGTHDSRSKINIATSYSDDNGLTWSNPIFAMKFNDYEEQLIEWPREGNAKNLQISGSASFIDSAIVQDDNGKVVLLADVMPAGIGNNNANRSDSGFKEVNGKYYLKLKKNGESAYQYTVRENGVVYNDSTNQPTNYQVNEKYEVLENGHPLTVEQYSVKFDVNSNLQEYHNGKQVPMNVFYKDSIFKVVPTNYIGMTSSSDSGESWKEFKLLPPFLGVDHNATYLSPGQGLALSNTNRLIFATYTSGQLTYLVSDDGGNTFTKRSAPVPFTNATAEAQMVELREGVIRTFFRTTTGKIAYMTSYDSGDTWSGVSYLDMISQTSYGTQVSVIKYSQKIDGRDAVILSSPNSTVGRKGGQLWVGLINADDSIDWRYHYNVDLPNYGYSYSALTELPNQHIGLFFEKYDSWSRNELHLSNVVQYVDLEIADLLK
ncbi:exo-alpha-sialidase [Enterococcus cecorum]|nr:MULTISPECIES: exo-alpha-sialidase [Enterococcus]EHQ8823398.1 exo-alpha-sialidase [Enterococcus faecalis]EHQ8837227.1 exo-alpha-sialidase [Enterococcus faecalis]EHZ5372433.1 exo-alpha-sialidase [Enterococcus faecalis]EIO9672792.1 exo-alpha-sialidase [Enterococcus faecalis]EIW2077320.1 exo-alpha-sialidase [Enterococcus faecalis]